ncbi:MAG TPA: hypothetical protein ENJ93_05200, partial [Chloroflexi bacterium]|nr:hypothetical protein [Chloroflexota bacterium]
MKPLPKRWSVFSLSVLAALAAALGALHLLGVEAAARPLTPATVESDITTDTVWTLSGSPYLITETVSIHPGSTLTIEPGVIVQAASPGFAVLSVAEGGRLEAVGIPTQPITFTSAANSGPGDWASVVIAGSANLRHTSFQNSVYNLDIIGATGGPVLIENSRLENSVYGLRVTTPALPRLTMSNITFTNNQTNRVQVENTGIISDNITTPFTLTAQSGLDGYEIPGVIRLTDGVTMRVEPGVTIFGKEFWVDANARVAASGTAVSPITFTSVTDSAPGEWNHFYLAGSAYFNYAHFRNGAVNLALISASGRDVVVENSDFEAATWGGLMTTPAAWRRLRLTNNRFAPDANRILLDLATGETTLAGNVIAPTQAGLAGYQMMPPAPFGNPALTVPQEITLTLEPGVTLWSAEDVPIQVNGRLQAIGTATNPITFTTLLTGMQRWAGIVVSGTADLRHTRVEESGGVGLRVAGGQVTAVCSAFARNTTAGVWVNNSGNPLVSLFDGDIVNNGAGVVNEHSIPVDA